jgi:hypothetical protein
MSGQKAGRHNGRMSRVSTRIASKPQDKLVPNPPQPDAAAVEFSGNRYCACRCLGADVGHHSDTTTAAMKAIAALP